MTRNEHIALEEGTTTESSMTDKQMWSRLWKLKVIPRVRVLWWRVLQGILPVEATLKYRHIATVSTCKICLHSNEDMMHALLECPYTRQFWDAMPEWIDVKRPTLHPLTWSRDILCDDQFSESDRATLVTVMWTIWTSQNNITHDKAAFNPIQSMRRVRETLADCDGALDLDETSPKFYCQKK